MSKTRSPITTHVLDLARGRAAAGVAVHLEKQSGAVWTSLARGATNSDGRVEELLPAGSRADAGIYRLTFETGAYFKSSGSSVFYPAVTVAFDLTDTSAHHHIPLLLSPFGYSTYRGT